MISGSTWGTLLLYISNMIDSLPPGFTFPREPDFMQAFELSSRVLFHLIVLRFPVGTRGGGRTLHILHAPVLLPLHARSCKTATIRTSYNSILLVQHILPNTTIPPHDSNFFSPVPSIISQLDSSTSRDQGRSSHVARHDICGEPLHKRSLLVSFTIEHKWFKRQTSWRLLSTPHNRLH